MKTIRDIDLDELGNLGIKLVIFDIDNTVVAWNDVPDSQVHDYLKSLKDAGFDVCFMTNNNRARAEAFNPNGDYNVIFHARKPFKKQYRAVLKHYGVKPNEACMVGDQLFTDVLGANRMGIYSIMVERMLLDERFGFKTLHKFENWLVKR